MPRHNKDTCLCQEENGHRCPWGEVRGAQYIRALREMGAMVKNGLGNRLPGQWARACWIKAYDAKKRLVGESKTEPYMKPKPPQRRRPLWPGGHSR